MVTARKAAKAVAVPPHNLEAEESVLGACMLAKSAIATSLEAGIEALDFYRPAHQTLWGAIVMLHARDVTVDPVTVAAELTQYPPSQGSEYANGLEEVGGRPYLHTLIHDVPTVGATGHYAEIVRNHAVLRNLADAAHEIAAIAYADPEDVAEALDAATALFGAVTARTPNEAGTPTYKLGPWGSGWKAELLGGWTVTATKLREHGEGITAEVKVQRGDRYRRVLKLNLGAPTSVDGFVGKVHGMWPRPPFGPWQNMLPKLLDEVIDNFRRPAAVVNLSEVVVEPEQTGFLIDPVVPYGDITILFGDSGTRKSTIALALLIGYVTGQMIPGVRLCKPRGPGVFFDFEWDKNPHAERLKAIQNAMGYPDHIPGLFYVRMTGKLIDRIDEMRTIISEKGAKFAVIDSLGLAAKGKLGDDEVALTNMAAIRELGITVLATGHITKEAANGDGHGSDRPAPKATIFGSTFWKASARMTWEVRLTEGEEGETDLLALWQDKVNRGKRKGGKRRPIAWDVTQLDNNDGVPTFISFQESGAGWKTRVTDDTGFADAIVEFLRTQEVGATTKEISLALGGGKGRSPDNVRNECWRHAVTVDTQTGELKKRGRGLFRPVPLPGSTASSQLWTLI